MFDEIGAGGVAVAEPAAPQAAPAPADPGAPPTPGRVPDSPSGSPESPNIRQLREQYEALKTTHESWAKIGGDPKEVAAQVQIVNGMRSEAVELGKRLGYDEAEVREFFAKDPIAVLNHLRQKDQSTQSQPLSLADAQKLVDRRAQELLKPYIDRQQEQLATQAEIKGQNEFNRLLGEHFKDGLPEECKSDIYARVEAALLADAKALERLMAGQVSDVQKYFLQEKDKFLKVYSAYGQHERKRTGSEEPLKPGDPPQPKSRMDAKLSTGQSVKDLFRI